MGLLNLTLAQLLAALIPLTGVLVALYFWDRSRRRVTVATLRFWPNLPAPPVTRRHKKLQQPLSLLLQILAMLLLLLAIADWRWGLTEGAVQHHVLILDASAATSALADGNAVPILESIKQSAEQYLKALPAGDRVLLLRADGLTEAATDFTDGRATLRSAVQATESGWTALDLGGALELAENSLRLALDARTSTLRDTPGLGEIVFIGGTRAGKGFAANGIGAPFRWIASPEPGADLGIRAFSAARATNDPTRWEVGLEVWNDSGQEIAGTVEFFFEGRKLGDRNIRVGSLEAGSLEFRIRTEQAGRLEARLAGNDAAERNDAAALELPGVVRQALAMESDRPARLRRLLDSAPSLTVVTEGTAGALTVVDRPTSEARNRVLYLDAEAAPIQIIQQVRGARVTSWFGAHPVGQGLRSADVTLGQVSVLRPEEGDVVIAAVEAGPVIVARDRPGERWVAFGFDLLEEGLANRLTAPLLFANAVRWFAPDVFRLAEFRATSPGTIELEVAPATREQIEVETLAGATPVWVYDQGRVRLFSPRPTTAQVRTPYRNAVLALGLPEASTARWTPPADALRGVPSAGPGGLGGIPLWPLLALAALAILAFDWVRFGRGGAGDSEPIVETLRVTAEPTAREALR